MKKFGTISPASTGVGDPKRFVKRKYPRVVSRTAPELQSFRAESATRSLAQSVTSCQPSPRDIAPKTPTWRPGETSVPQFMAPFHCPKEPPPPVTVPEILDGRLRRVKTWTIPAKAETPYSVPCGPRTISMWSMSSTGICESEGLKGPPTGTPSTVTRRASNSFSPQSPMLGSRVPLSEPSPVSRPTTFWSASATVLAPERRSSSPETTEVAPGTSTASSGDLVAETTTSSVTGAGVGEGVGEGVGAWPSATAASERSATAEPAAAQRDPLKRICPPSFPDEEEWTGDLPVLD